MKKYFTIFLLLFSVTIFAQKAALKGNVSDAKTGEILPAVNIVLVGTMNGTITDFDGNYQINNIEPRAYNIQFSFISYETKEIKNVVFKAGETKTINIKLGEAFLKLDLVEIVAKKVERTENAIVRMQHKSAVVINGISSQEMTKSGASNAASALKKVTGVSVQGGKYVYVRGLSDRYSKTILNGAEIPGLDPERNTVQMDLFPTVILDNMLVYKTFSPDLPSDFTGGLIDIKTKDFPDKYNFSFSAQVGFNPQSNLNKNFLTYKGGEYDFLGIDDGTRTLPTEAAGEIPDRYEDNEKLNSITKSFNKIWFPKNKTSGLNQKYSVGIGNQKEIFGKSLGFFVGGSYSYDYKRDNKGFYGRYKLTDKDADALNRQYESQLWEQGITNSIWSVIAGLGLHLNSTNDIALNLINNHSGQKNTSFAYFIDYRDNDDLRQRRVLEFNQRNLTSAQLKGNHTIENFHKLNINWIGSYALATQNEPDIRYMVNDIDITNGDTVYFVNKSMYSFPRRFYRDMREQNYFGKIDFELVFKFKEIESKLKFGFANTYKYREYRQNQINIAENHTNQYTDMSDYFADENISATDGIYAQNSVKDNDKNSYNGELNIFATYLMTDIFLTNKFRTVFGARVEKINMQTLSLVDIKEKINEKGKLDEINILPSINLTYSPNEYMNIRFGYNKTLARPSFREKSSMAMENQVGDIIVGNDSLKQTIINNFDLRWEKYYKLGELISFGVFYKIFKDPIERSFNTEAINPEITWQNVDNAQMYGLEAEFSKELDFVSMFKNFKLSANVTYVYSQVSIDRKELESKRYFDPNYSDKRKMFEQSPWIINGILSYKNDSVGWSANVSYTFNAGKLVIVNPKGIPDVYSKSTNNLSFNITKKLGEKFAIKFQVKNIINNRITYFYDYNSAKYNYLDYGWGREFSVNLSYKY